MGSLSVVSEARRGKAPARARCVRALSIQRLEGCRPAADAGPMQIQWWEGAVSSSAEAVLQSATRDSMSREAGCLRKRIVKSVVEELEKELRSAARHRGTERVETRLRKVLVLYRKREGARRLHEHGVFARFRYNDLKDAARRRTRALCKFNGGKERCRAVPRLCCRARHVTV